MIEMEEKKNSVEKIKYLSVYKNEIVLIRGGASFNGILVAIKNGLNKLFNIGEFINVEWIRTSKAILNIYKFYVISEIY